jgi:DNA-binding MarR family transcriptional regulator
MKKLTVEYALRATWLSIQKMYNEEAQKFGTTMSIGFALLSLDPELGTPSTALGPKMGIESTSLSRILKSMEELDLVYRTPNPNDGRGVLIHLTSYGKERRDYTRQQVLDFNQAVVEKISTEKLNNFFEVIDQINQVVSSKKALNYNEVTISQL